MIRKLGLFLLINGALFTATLLYEVIHHRSASYPSAESTSTTINLALRQAKEVSSLNLRYPAAPHGSHLRTA